MKRRVTLSQIAKRAGVSSVAVGAALGLLSRESNVRLSSQRAARIRQVAEEMGYECDLLARAFRQQRTGVIGVLFRVVSNPLSVSYLIDCIHRELLGRQFHVNLSPYQSSFDVLESTVRMMVAWRVDGLILCHRYPSDDERGRFGELEQFLDKNNVPLVLVESTLGTTRSAGRVRVDLEQAGFAAATHLVELGHRELAYVGDQCGAFAERWRGICRAVGRRRGARVMHLPLQLNPAAPLIHQYMLASVSAGRQIGAMAHRPTGLICTNDQVALGVMAGLREMNLHVPRDLSVVGYDNSDLAVIDQPGLTSLDPPVEEMARTAVALLDEQLDASSIRSGASGTQTLLQARLVHRGSSTPPPGRMRS